jgi:hypothetical protein
MHLRRSIILRRIFISTLAVVLFTVIHLVRASSQTSTRQNYDVGTAPYFLTAAHLDGTDTGADLIVSNHNSENLSVLRNKGDGTFQPATNIPVGKAPTAVVAADFTGLGKRDLAVALSGQDAILILLNKGNGEFQEPLKLTVTQAAGSLAAADFNRDGRDDLIVASLSANQATLLLSKDVGDWAAPEKLDLGYVPFFVTTADLNNDGNPDFITCPWQRSGPTQLGVHLGNGDGTFAESKRFYAGQNAYQVATGDFNQDGKLDLVTANNFSRGAHVLLGLGDGNFQTAINFPIGDCSSVITGDFNNDGQTDFAVTNSIEAKVIVMLGKGDGTFPNKQDFPVARGPIMLAVADFDRDGQRDLATANTTANNVTVVLGKAFNFPAPAIKLPSIPIP